LKSVLASIRSRASRANIPAKTGRIVAFSALFIVSALITLLVLLSGRNGAQTEPQAGNAPVSSVEQIIEDFKEPASQAQGSTGMDLGGAEALGVQDFMLPRDVGGDTPEPYLLRQRLERWQEEQVNRYWIPLEEIAADLIRRENDRRIEELFMDIP
jgi:hypothetical protein